VNRVTPWRFIVTFGLISLLGDVVYQGMRSISGPLLRDLGATAVTVGLVTGLGEAAALLFRLVSGPLADRSGHYWRWAMAGYGITALAVPLLGWSNAIWLAAGLIVIERFGKAVRSPAKDALLAHATAATGRGKGFAVHKALDQFGAVLGPLAVAGAMVIFAGRYGPSLTMLVLPGAAALALLTYLRRVAPHPAAFELGMATPPISRPPPTPTSPTDSPPAASVDSAPSAQTDPATPSSVPSAASDCALIDPADRPPAASADPAPSAQTDPPTSSPAPPTATGSPSPITPHLPNRFWWFATFAGVSLVGYSTFGLIAFHLVDRGLLATGLVPVLYAGAMAVDALVAVAMGVAYDRFGTKVLLALPVLCAILPILAFAGSLPLVALGVLGWGAAMAIQESTLRAVIADVIPPASRATAFGLFAAVTGTATAIGGALAGWLYQTSIPALIAVTIIIQMIALTILAFWLARGRHPYRLRRSSRPD